MGKKLTEEMVIARSKLSDLSNVKRLNCWGSELEDVSLLRKMPSVEVLSLSINLIDSLVDFQFCKELQELYIRQNAIRDLNQVCYLQGLTNLKNLWLGENPCAYSDGYRYAVLKALPRLQKLDNIAVTQEELRRALKDGANLIHPEEQVESEEEYVPPKVTNQRYQEYQEPELIQRSTSRQELECESEKVEFYEEESVEDIKEYSPPPKQISPPPRRQEVRRSYSPEEYVERRPNYEQEYYDLTQKSPPNGNYDEYSENHCSDPRIITSRSTNSIKDYSNGDKYSQPTQQFYRQSEGSEISSHAHEPQRREIRYTCPAPPFNRRPVTRNSNILSAVLCLVKELDYPSLEVVEMAVKCRMDEVEE